MKIEHISNALLQIVHKDRKIVCDPWMTPGAWDGSWFHYPPLRKSPKDLLPVDVLYISHMHPDHFDPFALKEFNRNATVIINKDWGHRLEPILRTMGFQNIQSLKNREKFTLDETLRFEMLSSFTDYCPIDSSLFIEWDGYRIMNLTENVLTPVATKMLKSEFPDVDVALLPYSGAGPFPQCFANLDSKAKKIAAQRVANERVDIFLNAVEALSPRVAVPIAGTYVLGGARWALSRQLAIPRKEYVKTRLHEVAERNGLRTQCVNLKEDSWLHLDKNRWWLEGEEDRFDEQFFEKYIASLADKKYLYEYAFSVPKECEVDLLNLCQVARQKMWRYQKQYDYFRDYNLYFDVGGEKYYRINFSDENVSKVANGDISRPYLLSTLPYNYFLMILTNLSQWNYADAGSHITYYRDPEVYEEKAMMLMNFFHV